MGIIFTIGGVEIRDLKTLDIDKRIVESCKKENPVALFIPTASGESKEYIEAFNFRYGEELGCKTDVLLLIEGKTTSKTAREKIMNSDIIYVGGGNTKKMLKVWKSYDVDKFLINAYEKGKTLSGVSAGGICWFKSGQSDSESFEATSKWDYIKVEGLNLIDAMHCPHYNEDTRQKDFDRKILECDEVGIAIDDNCVVEFKDDHYIVHKTNVKAKAYKLYQCNGKVIREELDNSTQYRLIRELLCK